MKLIDVLRRIVRPKTKKEVKYEGKRNDAHVLISHRSASSGLSLNE